MAVRRSPEPPGLLTAQEVARRLKIGVKTLYRLARVGVLPKPIRLSRKLLRWREDEVQRYINDNPGGAA